MAKFLAGIDDNDIYGRCEYWDGEIWRKPLRVVLQCFIQTELQFWVHTYLDANPLGYVFPQLHCRFAPERRVLVPDISVVLGQPEIRHEAFDGGPVVVVEIRSPGDRPSRVSRKIKFYLERGVRLLWLFDPPKRTVSVYRANGSVQDGILSGEDVLPGFEVPLAKLFPPK